MIKTLEKIIGQPEVKFMLNRILAKKNDADKKGEPFRFPPLFLSGLTGLGKSHFADAVAEALKEAGFQYFALPVKAGWRYFDTLAAKTCTFDDNDIPVAMPAVMFVDEAQEPSPIEEMVKLITGTNEPRLFERNGTKFFHDPTQHLWIFASNEEIDPAQKRRCLEIPFSPYNKGEKKQLLTAMSAKPIDADALEYLESRTKPTAGDIENLCKHLNLEIVDRITLDVAKSVTKHIGLFSQGLVKKDLMLMQRMYADKRPVPIDALKAKLGDVKTTATRGRLGWLQALELVEAIKGGFTLTNKGTNYVKALVELQQAAKAKRKPAVAGAKK